MGGALLPGSGSRPDESTAVKTDFSKIGSSTSSSTMAYYARCVFDFFGIALHQNLNAISNCVFLIVVFFDLVVVYGYIF